MSTPTAADPARPQALSPRAQALALLLLAVALLVLDGWGRPAPALPAAASGPGLLTGAPAATASPAVQTPSAWERADRGHIPMPETTPAAHASQLLVMPVGHPARLTAFWFAGERESAPDVRIAASQWMRASGSWTAAHFVLDRHTLSRQIGVAVRRLGNPVAWLDPQGRIHLFVVATGLGGWAASRIVHVRQAGADVAGSALRFEYVQTLPLAWWWNTSFLVRNAPLPLDDGGLLLPVHYELGIKYPVALRLDRDGRFLGAVRISARRHLLQPTLLALDSRNWLALMRTQRAGGSIAVAATADGGRHWADRADLALPNPDAAVAALVPGPGQGLLAYNPQAQGRTRLAMARSGDGRHWQPLGLLAEGGEGEEFSYPALAWADGDLWVSYTEQRRRIAWQRWRPTGAAP